MAFSIREKSSLKILHLYSDWRWTGPAEPVVQMCMGLINKGHNVILAYRKPPIKTDNITIHQKVKELGIPSITDFCLDRYMGIYNTIMDLMQLPKYLKTQKFQVLHMHLSHDHWIGGLCAKFLGKQGPVLIRTFHKRNIIKKNLFNKFLLKNLTHGYLFFTESFRKKYIERFHIDPSCTGLQPMTLNLNKFRFNSKYKDMRKYFGIPHDAILIGTVGRFQKYRRIDWFLEAAKHIIKMKNNVYFLLIGRSSHIMDTVINPINKLGISHRAIVAGYRKEDYIDTLACLDIFTLLMPGSDGTARALREAMALGKACVVSDYGMLPEIVNNGNLGIIIKDIKTLIKAWLTLIDNPYKRTELAEKAKKYAAKMFDIKIASELIEKFYFKILCKC